jgi:hypothetical protein
MTPDQEKALRAELEELKSERQALLEANENFMRGESKARTALAAARADHASYVAGVNPRVQADQAARIAYLDTALAAAQGALREVSEEMAGALEHMRTCVEAKPPCSGDDLRVLLRQYIVAEQAWLDAHGTSGKPGGEAQAVVAYVEIVDPMGRVSYRRPEDHPLVAEARALIAAGKVAYTIRDTGERVPAWTSAAPPEGHPAPACRDCGAIGIGVYPGMCDRCGGNGSAPGAGEQRKGEEK